MVEFALYHHQPFFGSYCSTTNPTKHGSDLVGLDCSPSAVNRTQSDDIHIGILSCCSSYFELIILIHYYWIKTESDTLLSNYVVRLSLRERGVH